MKQRYSMNRRDFLRTSLTLGAAVATPAFIPASALGGVTAPSERIGMGFVGLGNQGTGHLLGGNYTYVPGGFAAREDVQVIAVCDVFKERRDRALARCNEIYAQKLGRADYSGVRAYNDFREMLARPEIDAVLLALPYHWAAPMATIAMRAGKDVYCEKPVAITVGEGRELIRTSRNYGRVYQAGTQQRSEYAGKFRIAAELVRNGRIGRLKEVYAYRKPGAYYPTVWTTEESKPVPEGFDWDLWLGPLPWRPCIGVPKHSVRGSFVGDINWGPHHYDIIQWTLNPDPLAPIEVSYETTGDKPQTAVIHYRYANGVIVHSLAYPHEKVGNEGGAVFVGTEGRLAVDRNGIVSYPSRILNEPLRPEDHRVYHSDSHVGNFLECVRNRRQPICNPETAVYSMNAVLIGGLCLALRRTLKWDPAKAQFTGDEQANRLLSYTPRPPWRL